MRRIESVTKAYHSTRQKGLKKFESRTTTATIDTGEGAHIHGWGLYLQADEMQNREDYLSMFATDYASGKDYLVTIDGTKYIAKHTEDIMSLNDTESIDIYQVTDEDGRIINVYTEFVIMLYVNGYNYPEEWLGTYADEAFEMEKISENNPDYYDNEDIPEIYRHYSSSWLRKAYNFAKENENKSKDIVPLLDEDNVLEDGTHFEGASQYTVEIPDDMVFIDEDKPVPEWLLETYYKDFGFREGSRDVSWKDIDEQKRKWVMDYHKLNTDGRSFYESIGSTIFYLRGPCNRDEQASLWLSENGIDGMTYEGGRDGGCFVIYNCDKLKIVGEY